MIIAIFPLVVMVIGLLMYGWSDPQKNPKVTEIGRLLFFIGAFWLVYILAQRVVKF